MVVNGRAHEIEPVPLVHVHGNAVDLKLLVFLTLLVEAKHVAHARATAALDADAEAVPVGDVLLAYDFSNLLRGVGANINWRVRSGFGSGSHEDNR